MAKKKVTRKELLKGTDEFLTFSARTVIFVKEHSRPFTYLGTVIAAIALIYLGVNTYLNYVNKKGQNAYNIAYYSFAKNIDPKTDQKNLKEPAELFEQVMDKYGLSKVSRLAPPELAYLKFLEKKYDEAISLYQKFLDGLPENSPYQSLAKLALAACFEGKGELGRAIETLKQIMSGPDEFFKEQAMLSLARVYRLDNQQEKSSEILTEFVEKFKASSFLPMAKALLNKPS